MNWKRLLVQPDQPFSTIAAFACVGTGVAAHLVTGIGWMLPLGGLAGFVTAWIVRLSLMNRKRLDGR